MSLQFRQTGVASIAPIAACSGVAPHANAFSRVMEVGGTPAGAATAFSFPATTAQGVICEFVTPSLGWVNWAAGTYTVRVRLSTGNNNGRINAIHLCRLDANGNNLGSIGSLTGLAVTTTATTHVFSVTGTAQGANVGDRLMVIVVGSNSTTMSQSVAIFADQFIDTPITPGAFRQQAFRFRNDDGNQALATWKGALNANVEHGSERLRLRALIQNVTQTSGVQAFGLQQKRQSPDFGVLAEQPAVVQGLGIIGANSANDAQGQTFTLANDEIVSFVQASLGKEGNPVDGVYAELYSVSFPPFLHTLVLLGTSINVVPASDIAAGGMAGFAFPSITLPAGVCLLAVRRSGAFSTADYYSAWGSPSDVYPNGNRVSLSSGSWSNMGNDLAFSLFRGTSTPWAALPPQASTSVPVRYADSPHLADQALTTQQLGSGSFAGGRIYESPHTQTVTFTGNSEAELEVVIEPLSSQLVDGDKLQFRIVRLDGTPLSQYIQTPELTYTPVAGPPPAPVTSAATGVTTTGFTANWQVASGATSYRLDVSTQSNFSSFVTGFNNLDVGSNLSRAVTGLNPGTLYYYRVRAVNASGSSANSDTRSATTVAAFPPQLALHMRGR